MFADSVFNGPYNIGCERHKPLAFNVFCSIRGPAKNPRDGCPASRENPDAEKSP
jgi:hypothetical protein